jgi:hypothetical protein
MDYLFSKGLQKDEIIRDREKFGNVFVIPFDSIGVLTSIDDFSVVVKDKKIQGIDKTYFDFWKEGHGIELKKRSQATINAHLVTKRFPTRVKPFISENSILKSM